MQSLLGDAGAGHVYRKGKVIVVPRGAVLPPFCVKCGAPAADDGKKTSFSWHSRWLYLLILFTGPLFYVIVALVVRKKVDLIMPLCEAHRRLRRQLFWAGILLVAGSAPAAIFYEEVLSGSTGWAVLLTFVLFMAGLIVFSPARAFLRPVCIDETRGEAEFEGLTESVLAQLSSSPW